MNDKEVAKLNEIADKLDRMGDELTKSGVIGYGMSLKNQSRSIKRIAEEIE